MSDYYVRRINKDHLIMLGLAALNLLFPLVGFIVSYFVWNEYRKESDYIGVNGARLLDFHISFFIYNLVGGLLCIVIIGIFILPVVSIAYLVLIILGMIKYGTNQDYVYPFTIKFFSKNVY